MEHGFFTTILVQPIYNAFVLLISTVPYADAGIAIVLLTLIIRLIFYPTFSHAMKTQWGMRRIEGEMEEIKEKYKDNAMLRGEKTMELLRKNNVKPFASFLALLIQLPVFIALYIVFLREGFPQIEQNLLYSFVSAPQTVGVEFLGILNLTDKNHIVLAVIVVLAQYVQGRLSQGSAQPPSPSIKPERAQMMAMQKQMILYFLPVLMGVVTYTLPSAAGLYLLTNAGASIGQDFVVRRSLERSAKAINHTPASK